MGDVIVAADGQRFDVSSELTAYVRGQAGKEVTLTILRDGTETAVTVEPRVLTDAQRARGEGPIGFSYEPER